MLLMKEHDILHLPVKDDEEKLVGFLTLKDVLRIEPQLFEIITEMAELKRKPTKGNEGYCQECGNYSEQLVMHNKRLVCQYCAEEQ
jgi:CBS domain-containing protein